MEHIENNMVRNVHWEWHPCVECRGKGTVKCPVCYGEGVNEVDVLCLNCNGQKIIDCPDCGGKGEIYVIG